VRGCLDRDEMLKLSYICRENDSGFRMLLRQTFASSTGLHNAYEAVLAGHIPSAGSRDRQLHGTSCVKRCPKRTKESPAEIVMFQTFVAITPVTMEPFPLVSEVSRLGVMTFLRVSGEFFREVIHVRRQRRRLALTHDTNG
jgi:hypothetical protein